MEKWNGKVAVVSGASAGIGAQICRQMVLKGLQVVGLARREDRLKQLADELKALKASSGGQFHYLAVDMTQEERIVEAFRWIEVNVGPVSVLVNNAGILRDTCLIDGDSVLWRQVVDTNVMAVCIATREALKTMRAMPHGQVIHVNSVFGRNQLYATGVNVYGATKHAITCLTETLRRELIERRWFNIKITSLSPGIVTTEIFTNASEELKRIGNGDVALRCEDIADAVEYILATPPHVQIHELTIKPIGETL